MAVKYITVIKNGHFYCSFGQAWQVQQFVRAKYTKIPSFDREIKIRFC
jgi:hypothetical protein